MVAKACAMAQNSPTRPKFGVVAEVWDRPSPVSPVGMAKPYPTFESTPQMGFEAPLPATSETISRTLPQNLGSLNVKALSIHLFTDRLAASHGEEEAEDTQRPSKPGIRTCRPSAPTFKRTPQKLGNSKLLTFRHRAPTVPWSEMRIGFRFRERAAACRPHLQMLAINLPFLSSGG